MIERLMTETVTVIRRQTASSDGFGDPVRPEEAGVEYRAYIEPTQAQEVNVGREVATSDWLLVLPASAAIDAGDEVTHEGRRFDVLGPPALLRTPRGPHHIEARLRHIGG